MTSPVPKRVAYAPPGACTLAVGPLRAFGLNVDRQRPKASYNELTPDHKASRIHSNHSHLSPPSPPKLLFKLFDFTLQCSQHFRLCRVDALLRMIRGDLLFKSKLLMLNDFCQQRDELQRIQSIAFSCGDEIRDVFGDKSHLSNNSLATFVALELIGHRSKLSKR